MMSELEKSLAHLRELRRKLSPPMPVLVVEDNDAERELMVLVLNGLNGFAVFEAASGQAALMRIESQRFELVFLDLRLNCVPDGLEVLRLAINKTKFVVVTGLDDGAPDVIEAMRIGAIKFIAKPLTADKITKIFD